MRSGMTQLELIVVLIVGGILTALAVPRLARLRDASSVRAAMTDVGAAFATARQAAVTRRAVGRRRVRYGRGHRPSELRGRDDTAPFAPRELLRLHRRKPGFCGVRRHEGLAMA